MSFVVTVTAVLASLPVFCYAADGVTCYTSGGVTGIVIATVVVTVVVGGLAAAAVWYLWKQRTDPNLNNKKPGSVFFGSTEKGCSLDHHPSEKRPLEGGKEAYAFDNPYFKDDETDITKTNPDAAEKGEAGFRADNGDIKNSSAGKVATGLKPKKNRPFSNIPFPNVFNQGSKKPRAMDDTCIPKPLERVEVPLRGHDFTGLGFNICGNMRDGIFVKDVLHRGPASESGKIKAGDKIIGVRVSFGGMVYEDALTILSYASPYDVQLELEKTAEADRGKHLVLPASSPSNKTSKIMSSSFRTGQRLFHPLYRSQSFDDLTQIGKDNNFRINNNCSNKSGAGSAGSKNSSTNCPKRSQSIETAGTPKPTVQLKEINSRDKTSRNPSTSSSESTKKTLPEQTKGIEEIPPPKATSTPPKVKSSRFHIENFLQKKAPDISSTAKVSINVQANSEVKNPHEVSETPPVVDEPPPPELPKTEEPSLINHTDSQDDNRPTAPPRKSGLYAKRKAPAPPSSKSSDSDTNEISAIVHRDAEEDNSEAIPVGDKAHREGKESEFKDDASENEIKSEDVHGDKRDVQSVSGEPLEVSAEDEDSSSSSKRKASSLGDLTKLELGVHKKSPVTTTILERAVSLDLQQSLPEEGNLVKQKMILKAPTFEDLEDVIDEDLSCTKKSPPGNLKRWEENWSKLQNDNPTEKVEIDNAEKDIWSVSAKCVTPPPPITNGHFDDDDPSTADLPSYTAFDSPDSQQFQSTPISSGNSIHITSTTIRKIIEADSFFKNDVDIDDIPYLGDTNFQNEQESQESPSRTIAENNVGSRHVSSVPVVSPISLTIPIIKPDFSQYEKLPSPASSSKTGEGLPELNHIQSEASVTTEERQGVLGPDLRTIHSSYKPVFSVTANSVGQSSKPADDEDSTTNASSTSLLSALDRVNGNGLDLSSFGQYTTASEKTTEDDQSTSEVPLLDTTRNKDFSVKRQSSAEISSIKIHSGGAAGFAKTLIISTPIEGDSISLNADLDSPPPQLEPAPQ